MYNRRIFIEIKFKRKNNPNKIQRTSIEHSRPDHHTGQVYLSVNSDASELNIPTGYSHDAESATYKTCVLAWLGLMLGLAATA
jgi:hypothetical protein